MFCFKMNSICPNKDVRRIILGKYLSKVDRYLLFHALGIRSGMRLTLLFMRQAAENGHLEVLRWLRENGCPWDFTTCSSAAKNGHLEVLQWACENGCPDYK